jgi:hypothetical protein
MTGIIILVAWLSLLSGLLAGIAWHAYRLANVTVMTRRFVAELLTAALIFSVVIWGLPLAGAAFGVCHP